MLILHFWINQPKILNNAISKNCFKFLEQFIKFEDEDTRLERREKEKCSVTQSLETFLSVAMCKMLICVDLRDLLVPMK